MFEIYMKYISREFTLEFLIKVSLRWHGAFKFACIWTIMGLHVHGLYTALRWITIGSVAAKQLELELP